MKKPVIKLRCPLCRKRTVTSAAPDFPFCSERCRLIDLGKWASGEYRIPAPLDDPPEMGEDNMQGDDDEPGS
jgi:endogenous inhibitor of DNA gyrase (YacG/DUF329 family)